MPKILACRFSSKTKWDAKEKKVRKESNRFVVFQNLLYLKTVYICAYYGLCADTVSLVLLGRFASTSISTLYCLSSKRRFWQGDRPEWKLVVH